jgi:hypothetical protein
MARTHRRQIEDDDNPFDERGVLKDGRTVRVSLMDALDVRTKKKPDDDDEDEDDNEEGDDVGANDGLRITDGQGNSDLGLHRPGFRIADGKPRVKDHYDSYNARAANSFKGDAVGGSEGDTCTIDGSPGHLQTRNGQLVCVPDEPATDDHATTDQRDAAYEAYNENIRNLWKS